MGQIKSIRLTFLKQSYSLFLPSETVHLTIFINRLSTSDHCRRKMTFQYSSILFSDPDLSVSTTKSTMRINPRGYKFKYLLFVPLHSVSSLQVHNDIDLNIHNTVLCYFHIQLTNIISIYIIIYVFSYVIKRKKDIVSMTWKWGYFKMVSMDFFCWFWGVFSLFYVIFWFSSFFLTATMFNISIFTPFFTSILFFISFSNSNQ